MTYKLTSEQCDALDHSNGPLALEDERTHRIYYVVDEPTFATLQQQEDLAAIRAGIADMEAGRVITLEELDVRIRSRLSIASK